MPRDERWRWPCSGRHIRACRGRAVPAESPAESPAEAGGGQGGGGEEGRLGLHLGRPGLGGEEGRAGHASRARCGTADGLGRLRSQAHGGWGGWRGGELRAGLGPQGRLCGLPSYQAGRGVGASAAGRPSVGRLPPGWLQTSGMSGVGCTEFFCIWLSFSFFNSDERTSLHCPSLLSACPTHGAPTVPSRAGVEGRGPVSSGLALRDWRSVSRCVLCPRSLSTLKPLGEGPRVCDPCSSHLMHWLHTFFSRCLRLCSWLSV